MNKELELEMEFPEACAFLEQVKESEQRVQQLEMRIENLRMLTTDTSVHLSDMPHTPSPDQQKLLTLLANIDELERELEQAKQEMQKVRMSVGSTICQIEDPLIQRILLLRYLYGNTWSEIQKALPCSNSTIYRFRDEGVEILDQLLISG